MNPNQMTEVAMLQNTTIELLNTMATTPALYQYVIPVSAVMFLAVFSLLIIVTNVTVLLVYTFTNVLRVPVSVYMKSLACADLWVGINTGVNIAFTLNNGQWPFGLPLCKLVGYLLAVSVGVSVTTLTVISIDRYIAICHPMRYHSIISKDRARLIAVVVWILNCLLYLPSNFDWFRSNPTLRATNCTLHFRFNISWSFFVIAITIIPNFVLSFLSYIFIVSTLTARHTWLRKTTEHGTDPQSASATARRKEQERLMAKIGMAILSAFYVTWLPYMAFGTVRQLGLSSPSQTAINLSLYLGISNSFLNGLIYSIANKAFRSGVRELFVKMFCCCRRGKTSQASIPTDSSTAVTEGRASTEDRQV